jgi:hypothetical protein
MCPKHARENYSDEYDVFFKRGRYLTKKLQNQNGSMVLLNNTPDKKSKNKNPPTP